MVVFRAWQTGIVVALFVAWAALLISSIALGEPSSGGPQRAQIWLRMGSSIILALVAWLSFAFTRSTALGTIALFIAIGMTLGLLGDLLLSGVIPVPQPTLAGIASFGLGHVCYLTAALGFAGQFKLNAAGPRWGMLTLWWVIAAVLWYFVVFNGQKPSILTWAALPYALLLATVTGLFFGLALQSPMFIVSAIAALLFLASDLILASQLFAGRTFPQIGNVIWGTYGPGQAGIVAAVLIVVLTTGATLV
jgi:hypothetical protein